MVLTVACEADGSSSSSSSFVLIASTTLELSQGEWTSGAEL